jgi:acetyl-CoA C-acetyltransferase
MLLGKLSKHKATELASIAIK